VVVVGAWGKAVGIIVSIVFALIALYLGSLLAFGFTPYLPSTPSQAPPQQWFATFRALDVAFLSLAVFAATVGVAALFRYEGERPGPEEETLVEKEVEEEAEEEV